MEIKVKLSNLRTAPRKTRLVADLVRGKDLAEAQSILSFTINKTAKNILKLLNSAEATATHDLHLDKGNLFISKIMVDEGPKMKRWHPMSRGRAYPIIKRSSHIVIVLSEKKEGKKSEVKKDISKNEQKEIKKEKVAVKSKRKIARPKTETEKSKTKTKIKKA
jgi:large subunit ribosomal protein L22